MKTKLIIIRGNSGSGKTTIAKKLQRRLGKGTLLVSQDVVRREMLMVNDTRNNLAIDLIKQIAEYGIGKTPYVIVEGILANIRYRNMLLSLIESFDGNAYVYYFDLSFEETFRRHVSKPNQSEFGQFEMRRWWNEEDYLGIENEVFFHDRSSKREIMEKILDDLRK